MISLLRIKSVRVSLIAWPLLSFCFLGNPGHAASSNASNTPDRPAHHTDSGYKNLYIEDIKKGPIDLFKMRFFGEVKWVDPKPFADQIPWRKLDLDQVLRPGDAPQVSWLGHSTFLIQYRGINILTDPVFSDRASPLRFAGPKRYTRHVVDYEALPPIDYVVISHNHYDHLDSGATKTLSKQTTPPRYYVPLGIGQWLLEDDRLPNEQDVVEMDWGDQATHQKVQISAYPSQHWSARGLSDRFNTLWASWRIEWDDFSFWFAGDSGYNERLFGELGKAMPGVDLALIPIGAYSPRDFMKAYHMNPEEAVKLHQQINTKQSIGMHWGTYPLTAETPTEPPIRLQKATQENGLAIDEFSVMSLGETRVINLGE